MQSGSRMSKATRCQETLPTSVKPRFTASITHAHHIVSASFTRRLIAILQTEACGIRERERESVTRGVIAKKNYKLSN